MNWQRRRWLTDPKRTYWHADVGGGVFYTLETVPFRGWQASRNEQTPLRSGRGSRCVLPPLMRTKAEAVAWCENDYAQRQMEIVGIA